MKEKNIVELVKNAEKNKHANLQVSRRAQFISMAADIQKLKSEGYTYKFIHETLIANHIVEYSYQTFIRLARRFLTLKKTQPQVETTQHDKPKITQDKPKKTNPDRDNVKQTITKSDQKFSMNSTPDIEDLI